MIRLEKTLVHGWDAAIRGMRSPMNSWDKSDSVWPDDPSGYIGTADLALMKKLILAGSDHRKFMRFITVTVDITAPMYWWSEYDTYKVGTVANSCSKMHKMLAKPFEMEDFSFDKLPGYKHEIKQFRPDVEEGKPEHWQAVDIGYEVSDCGRIRHHSRMLSGSLHKDGYIFVTIRGKQIPLHRLVAQAFCDGYAAGLEVNHIDGNRQNNYAYNLEWVTRAGNQQHAVDNHLQPKGLPTYKGKFTAEQRAAIKAEWDSCEISKRKLAEKYGVSHTCICDIINDRYKYAENVNLFEEVARPLVDTLNELRDSYMACEDEADKKVIWYSILQLLPTSYNQRRTVLMNYEVLRNMYHARKAHKLDEWREGFCSWVKSLPYAELITGGADDDGTGEGEA